MRKINTRGLSSANKVMHMAAIAYNLKKYLNYQAKKTKVEAKFADQVLRLKKAFVNLQKSLLSPSKKQDQFSF